MRIRTIDAHCGGEPLRLIVEGFPSPRGRTMRDKCGWAERHADAIRRALMLEPRGHGAMCGAVLTEPVTPAAHAGVLFLHTDGYPALLGHGIVAAVTIALERGLMMPGGDGSTIVLDTVAGTVTARARLGIRNSEFGIQNSKFVEAVTFSGIPSFVMLPGVPIRVGPRQLRVDVSYGGGFYAIVDGEAAGLPLAPAMFPELGRMGMAIAQAVEAAQSIVHPADPAAIGIEGTVFTAPPHDARADLRSVAVFANGQVDRSPCGAGMSAIMAVLDAMELVADDRPFVLESAIGTHLRGRVAKRTVVGEYPAIVPEIEGTAWITGEHTFVVDEEDPLKDGIA